MHFVCEIYKMSTHFKWYPGSDDVVVPWNARYSFPSQANKTVKLTPRIPPKNGSEFQPGNVIRLEFPAQGYVNPSNTTLSFDVVLTAPTGDAAGASQVRFQNNIQSIFSRVRLLYGSTPIEDIVNYNVIVRALTEWSSSNMQVVDQASVNEGIGGITFGSTPSTMGVIGLSSAHNPQGLVNIRQAHIQGIDTIAGPGTKVALIGGAGVGNVPNSDLTRKYQISFALGMFTQEKLIPTKFMASQLAIELTLENAAACIIHKYAGTLTTPPSYLVKNVNLIPEILEFDASYDSMFLMGLQQGGVPIKFSSWHTYIFSTGGAARLNLQIQERSRSVKALFAVQRRSPATFTTDSGALHFATHSAGAASNTASFPAAFTLQDYQFRIGGRYYPAAPVQCSLNSGSPFPNGGAEALTELQKALNQVGDYRLSTAVNNRTWGIGATFSGEASGTAVRGGYDYKYVEHDYTTSMIAMNYGVAITSGVTSYNTTSSATTTSPPGGNAFAGNTGSANFGMAIDLETSNGVEISGLNAEEQVFFIINQSLIFPYWSIILTLKKALLVLKYTRTMTR